MTLKFKAVDGRQVPVPGAPRSVGQRARFVGLKWDGEAVNPISGKKGNFVPGEPYECPIGSGAALRLMRLACKGDVLPSDKATAAVCGVPFNAEKKG